MKLYILGAGGFGREVAFIVTDYIKSTSQRKKDEYESKISVAGYIDEDSKKKGNHLIGYSVLGGFSYLEKLNSVDSTYFVCAIGNVELRKKLVDRALEIGLQPFEPIIYPNVVSSKHVAIDKGSIICPSCVLTVDIEIGSHVHVHSDVTIGHDVIIKDFANISPGVHLCGGSIIEEGADVGTGANVLPNVKIGAYSIVGAGALVNKDVLPGTTVGGVPAKKLVKNKV